MNTIAKYRLCLIVFSLCCLSTAQHRLDIENASNQSGYLQAWEQATLDEVAGWLQTGSSVNARVEVDLTPLMFAALLSNYSEIIKMPINAGSKVNARAQDGRRNSDSYQVTQKLIRYEKTLTAVVALLGAAYLGILRALHDSNKRIPQNCSLICLGSAAAARWTIASITTLDDQLSEFGRVATELLLGRIKGRCEAKQVILPAQLAQRESTGSPKIIRRT